MRNQWTWVSQSHSHSCVFEVKCTWRKAGERLTFTEARMQLSFCWSILCILLPELKRWVWRSVLQREGQEKMLTWIFRSKTFSRDFAFLTLMYQTGSTPIHWYESRSLLSTAHTNWFLWRVFRRAVLKLLLWDPQTCHNVVVALN